MLYKVIFTGMFFYKALPDFGDVYFILQHRFTLLFYYVLFEM